VTGLGAQMNLDFMFPGWAQDVVAPYINITLISSVFATDKDGDVVMTSAMFQLDIFGDTFAKGLTIAGLIKTYIESTGSLSSCSFYIEDERELGEEEAKKFRRSLDIAVEKQSL
jgi:hypothetical protein